MTLLVRWLITVVQFLSSWQLLMSWTMTSCTSYYTFGITENALLGIKSYMSQRTQRISIGSELSNPVPLDIGVFQGSGPKKSSTFFPSTYRDFLTSWYAITRKRQWYTGVFHCRANWELTRCVVKVDTLPEWYEAVDV